MEIQSITHPKYDLDSADWAKYRLTFLGGKKFVNEYLEKYSIREDENEFTARKNMAYCPAFAKSSIMDIKNAIYQRMVDITRVGGSESYKEAIAGKNKGVDLAGNSMDGFIGRYILPELLTIGKVGVYVDRPTYEVNGNLKDSKSKTPYIYWYAAEQIKSWAYGQDNELISLLLMDNVDAIDAETGLITDTVEEYRLINKQDDGIHVSFYDSDGTHLIERDAILSLKSIPFVIFEITQSLLIDVADYQIALLNLASSDLNYSLKSNYPFYTEQFNMQSDMGKILRSSVDNKAAGASDGTADEAKTAKPNSTATGGMQGRRYGQGLDRPGFISPPSEPLRVSMEKQEILKQEIRQLVNLALENIQSARASAESKKLDEKGLEAGLSYIGLELEYGERQIAEIWAEYENSESPATINYPDNYSLRTDDERREEAKELSELIPILPSKTYQKVIAVEIAKILVNNKVPQETMEIIINEIESAKVVVTDPETIWGDHEKGLVGDKLASTARGYPEDEYEQAAKDHADRAVRILAAQKSGVQGVDDINTDNPDDKKISQNPDLDKGDD